MAFNIGDRVAVYTPDLMNILDDGTIEKIDNQESGDLFYVAFEDGNTEWVTEERLEKLNKTLKEKLVSFITIQDAIKIILLIIGIICVIYALNRFPSDEVRKNQINIITQEIIQLENDKIKYYEEQINLYSNISEKEKSIEEINTKIKQKQDKIYSIIKTR